MNTLAIPLRLPAFRRLLAAYAVNGLGTWFGEVALAALVLERTGSPIAVALVLVCGQLIPSLLGPLLTARIERAGRPALPELMAIEASVFAVLAMTAGSLPVTVILALVLCDGLCALPARAVGRARSVHVTDAAGCLHEGNAALNFIFSVHCAGGAALAGLTVTAAGFGPALALDALSFAACALLLRHERACEHVPDDGRPRARVREALVHVRSHKTTFRLLCGEGLAQLLLALIIPVEIVFITGTLGGKPSDYGLVLSAWGCGMIAGSAHVPRLRNRSLTTLCLTGLFVMAAAYLGMGLATSVSAATAWSALGGLGNGIECFAILTLVQERTPPGLQLPVNALLESINRLMPGAGFLLGGLVAGLVDPRAAYIVAAGGVTLVTISLALSLRSRASTVALLPAVGAAHE